MIPIYVILFFVVLIILNSIKILKEYERAVVFRLGRVTQGGSKGPGLIILLPFIDKMKKVTLRTIVHDVPTQDIISLDNVTLKVNAVVYFRVVDAEKATIEVEDYFYATSQLSQTILRSVLGQSELDDILSKRDKLNLQLQEIIDAHTDPWGVKVSTVEIKQVDLPQEMQRAMARQAEAERYRRAKVIAAEGEFQASQKLTDAAEVLSSQPSALTLRYLQTLAEIAAENNSTTLFPIPIDLFKPFMENMAKNPDVLKQLRTQGKADTETKKGEAE
jgi:regulator of protease activity HflC (stomatin/prohibitin superfamily)